MQLSLSVQKFRKAYPRGLVQPEKGFRFSVDALLLASFCAGRVPRRVVDLGTGCGVISMGLLLTHPMQDFQIFGLDIQPEMVAIAAANADNLGFSDRFTAIHGDVRKLKDYPEFQPDTCDLVLCNPPYRLSGQGREPSNEAKRSAKFEIDTKIEDFVRGASRILSTKGRLCMVHLPEHLNRILKTLTANNLEPKRLRLVHPYNDRPASLLLLEAGKGANPGITVDPPLILYVKAPSIIEQISQTTSEALSFCPFLRCNSSRDALQDANRS